MKDIPMFTTEYGVASLLLKEIPYRETAYVRVRSVLPGKEKELLEECAAFCRMAGAEHIYAAGELEGYPLHTVVCEMCGEAVVDRERVDSLFPVTDATVARWREIYNEKMRHVDNAETLTARDEDAIVRSGGAYFIHEAGELLGIGWLEDTKLLAIAVVQPGAGWRVANTLLSIIEGETVTLEVASTNQRAIALYEKLGFFKVREVSRWYRIGKMHKNL